MELLAAGIHVIGALNVQHLESLNDLVERTTGVRVRETVPDRFVEEADQVVNLDLAVEDLMDRLRAGKIYPADRIPWALEHFFTGANLATLRELALREVAEALDRNAKAGAPPSARGQAAAPPPGRVMVCLSSNPPRGADAAAPRLAPGRPAQHRLVRGLRADPRTSRRSGSTPRRSATSWRTPSGPASWGPRWCGSRGTTRWWRSSTSPARTGSATCWWGGPARRWWRRLLGRSVMQRLVEEAIDLDVHVVGLPRGGAAVTLRAKLAWPQAVLALALACVGGVALWSLQRARAPRPSASSRTTTGACWRRSA